MFTYIQERTSMLNFTLDLCLRVLNTYEINMLTSYVPCHTPSTLFLVLGFMDSANCKTILTRHCHWTICFTLIATSRFILWWTRNTSLEHSTPSLFNHSLNLTLKGELNGMPMRRAMSKWDPHSKTPFSILYLSLHTAEVVKLIQKEVDIAGYDNDESLTCATRCLLSVTDFSV